MLRRKAVDPGPGGTGYQPVLAGNLPASAWAKRAATVKNHASPVGGKLPPTTARLAVPPRLGVASVGSPPRHLTRLFGELLTPSGWPYLFMSRLHRLRKNAVIETMLTVLPQTLFPGTTAKVCGFAIRAFPNRGDGHCSSRLPLVAEAYSGNRSVTPRVSVLDCGAAAPLFPLPTLRQLPGNCPHPIRLDATAKRLTQRPAASESAGAPAQPKTSRTDSSGGEP